MHALPESRSPNPRSRALRLTASRCEPPKQAAEKPSHLHQDTMTQRGTKPTIDAFTDLVRLRVLVAIPSSLLITSISRAPTEHLVFA